MRPANGGCCDARVVLCGRSQLLVPQQLLEYTSVLLAPPLPESNSVLGC